MLEKKLYLDFDNSFVSISNNDVLVLTNSYENNNAIDVRKFKLNLKSDIQTFESSYNKLKDSCDHYLKDILISSEAYFYRTTIGPIAQWFEAIDYVFANFKITEVHFSSYTKNKNIFVYEAEGEVNKKFLYNSSFYLSNYIFKYFENKYKITPKFEKLNSNIKVNLFFTLRNFTVLFFVFFKTLFFKIYIRNRGFLNNSNANKIISSRAIVQTEFSANLLKYDKNTILIANEQSFKLLKHRKYLQKINAQYLYSEGYVKISFLLKLLFNSIVLLKGNQTKNKSLYFHDITFNLSNFLPDLVAKNFDYNIYGYSVYNMCKKYNLIKNNSKAVSFEMFTPYAYYLKKYLKIQTIQIQTTLIEPKPNPNFIVSDHFYFSDPITYQKFKDVNLNFEHKISCIPYLKFIGINKKELNNQVNTLTYFTQPIDIQEENTIINYLDNFCAQHDLIFNIKLHPRQNNTLKLKKGIYLSNDFDIKQVMLDSDLVLTRSSTVGLDAWIYGVPVVFLKLSEQTKSLKLFYAPDDYTGSICELTNLNNLILNYPQFKNSFLNHNLYKTIEAPKDLNINII